MEIRWNKAKHDTKVNQAEADKVRDKILKHVGKVYAKWKYELTAKAIPETDLVPQLYRLRELVMQEVDGVQELKEWRAFTFDLFDDVISKTMTVKLARRNEIVEYIPDLGQADTAIFQGDTPKRRTFTFDSPEDFLAVPFVKEMREKPGFIGFVLRRTEHITWVCGYFNDDVVVPCGKCSNLVGIAMIPTEHEFRTALAQHFTESADAPQPSATNDPALDRPTNTPDASPDAPQPPAPRSDPLSGNGSPDLG